MVCQDLSLLTNLPAFKSGFGLCLLHRTTTHMIQMSASSTTANPPITPPMIPSDAVSDSTGKEQSAYSVSSVVLHHTLLLHVSEHNAYLSLLSNNQSSTPMATEMNECKYGMRTATPGPTAVY